jgi:hypothetical protein
MVMIQRLEDAVCYDPFHLVEILDHAAGGAARTNRAAEGNL